MIDVPRLVVQYNSLYKVIGNYDLIVLDEYCSTEAMQYGFVDNKSQCYMSLKQRIHETPQVMIMDAGLENKHVLNLTRMTDRKITVHQNLSQKHTNKGVIIVKNKESIKIKLLESLRDGKRVSVPVGTKALADYFEKCVQEELPNIRIIKHTAETVKGSFVDVTTTWSNYDLILYTSCVEAGNSYTDGIDEVFCVMDKSTCGPKSGLQMIMRCRNVVSGNIYLCVDDSGPSRSILPATVSTSFKSVKNYLSQRRVMIRGLNPTNTMPEDHPELRKIPLDLIPVDYIRGTIDVNSPEFNGYCGYIQDKHKQDRNYMFYILLYLRDQGVGFRGELKDIDVDEVEDARADYVKYRKSMNEQDVEDKANAADIDATTYSELLKAGRERKIITKEQRNSMYKYKIMQLYGIENTPKWFIKATKNKTKKYSNLNHYRECIGVTDEIKRQRLMANCAVIGMSKLDDDNIFGKIKQDDAILNTKRCMHALNLMHITVQMTLDSMGMKTLIPMTYTKLTELYQAYIKHYVNDVVVMVNNVEYLLDELQPRQDAIAKDIKMTNPNDRPGISLPYQKNVTPEYCPIKIVSKIINAAFGMNIVVDKRNTCLIDNKITPAMYIVCPWIVIRNKLLPRKDYYTNEGLDLIIMEDEPIVACNMREELGGRSTIIRTHSRANNKI